MDVHRLRNLTFLLSLGGLSTACFTDDGPRGSGTGPGESTGGTTDATTGGVDPGATTGSDAATTTTTTGAVDSTDTSTTEPAATTTTTGPTTDASTTDLTTTTTTGPDPDPVRDACLQYGALYVECYPRYARVAEQVVAHCQALLEKGEEIDGPACGNAFEEYFSCISALECAQLAQEFNQPFLCAIQYEFVEQFCPETGNDL